MVVMEIVFAGPQQLHGYADFLRDRRRFEHVIVGEAPAEPATGAAEVHGDIAFVDFEQLGYLAASARRSLARRPELQLAVFVVRLAVLRLKWRVRNKGVGIGRFDQLRG